MNDELPKNVWKNERAIVNLEKKTSQGSHWCSFYKKDNIILYFDSIGNLAPTNELSRYFGKGSIILYNHQRFQPESDITCGHWTILFLISTCLR